MLKISRLADYSTVIMRLLAEFPEVNFSASQIAERTEISLPTVSKVLKLLQEAGLLLSTRGSNGGYRLAHAPTKISLNAVIAAIDGATALTICCSQKQEICGRDALCQVKDHWQLINYYICRMLDNIKLADLLHPVLELEQQLLSNASSYEKRSITKTSA